MKISVFCSANSNIDPDFFTLTRELGQWIGREGHTLVYGGVDMGLMECVAEAAAKAGGMVTGVIPSRLEKGGRTSQHIHTKILCETLGERKQLMLQHSDVAIALPGGIGTLDEIFSMASEGTLAYHDKRVVVYNMKGFWDSLIHMLDDLNSKGMTRKNWRTYIQVANSLEDIVKLLA